MKKYMDLEDMVNINCSNVLNIIQKSGQVSRKEITCFSGLSWGGMTKIVNKLIEKGYITEKKMEGGLSASGRTPSLLSVNKEKNFIVGLDLNQTGLSAVVLDLTGEILKSYTAPAGFGSRQELEESTVDFVSRIFEGFEKNAIIAIGVAMQGIVDNSTGVCERFFANDEPESISVKELLENRFSVNVFVEHDPDCMLFSHLSYESRENVVLLRIDKSIGMAIAVGGKIIKRKGIFEIAHNCVIPGGIKCRCGLQGCLGAYIEQCFKNNEIQTKKIDELMLPLSVTVKNLANLFNADKIILTGALMEHKEAFEDKLSALLEEYRCQTKAEIFPVSDFAVRGAGLIAIQKSIASLEI